MTYADLRDGDQILLERYVVEVSRVIGNAVRFTIHLTDDPRNANVSPKCNGGIYGFKAGSSVKILNR